MWRLPSVLALAIGIVILTVTSDYAAAERRVALVIGNSNYKNPSLNLSNPKNDAGDMAKMLDSLGFEVVQASDASKRDFDFALQKFARLATNSDSALFYYAGHAMQYQGRNYLMPVDAELEDDVSLSYQMVSMDTIKEAIDRANGVKIVILDACRNNPLADRLAQRVYGSSRAAGQTRGLARIDRAEGMVVAYATSANDVAADGSERNSPFTGALLKRLQDAGVEVGPLFRQVGADVIAKTRGQQRPELVSSLTQEYYLNQSDRLVWDQIKDSGDVQLFRDFIAKFGTSKLATDARYRIEVIERQARDRELDKLRAELAEAQRQRVEREAEQKRLAEEQARANELARLRAERAAAERRLAEEQAKISELLRLQAERDAAARRQAEEDARLAELARQKAAQEEIARREAAEKARLAEAEQKRQAEEQAKLAEAARVKAAQEAEARRLAADQAKAAEVARLAREEAARVAAEQAKQVEAMQQRAKQLAADRERVEQERRVAEAARLKAEQEAADRKQAEEQAKVAEATRRREAEEQAKVAEAVRLRAEKEAEERRQADERARVAEAARVKADQDAAERQKLEQEAFAKVAEAERQRQQLAVTQEAERRQQQVQVIASLPQPGAAEPAVRIPAPAENTAELIRAAQGELRRLGCFTTTETGVLDAATQNAFKRFRSARRQKATKEKVTDGLVAELKDIDSRVCPLVCPKGEIARGEACIAMPKRQPAERPQRNAADIQPRRIAPAPAVRAPAPPRAAPSAAAPSRTQPSSRPMMLGF